MGTNHTEINILVIGALGQIGQELTESLRAIYGSDQVIPTDIQDPKTVGIPGYKRLDVLDKAALYALIESAGITHIYNLAAILSAKGEQDPQKAWEINMGSLFNTLEALRETSLQQLFWPSSIAVFGPNSPQENTPQLTVMDPNTVYGISKLAGERWCEYYATRYGLDVRSLRYPGLIGYKTLPGGGTTDYAVEIFHKAIQQGSYTSYLSADSFLPMMYMPDAIRATIQLMQAPAESIRIRSAYNLSGMSISPGQLTSEIQATIPAFTCTYKSDFRQQIADSWPASINDLEASRDWGWKPEFGVSEMVADMLFHIQRKYQSEMVEEA